MTKKILLFACVLVCSCYALWPRVELERENNNVAILADYREVATLARNSGVGVDEALAILKANGIRGLMVSELLGDNIDRGIGQAEMKTAKNPDTGLEGTRITIMPNAPEKELLNKWLHTRFNITDDDGTNSIILTMPSNMLRNSGMLPDIDGLLAAKRSELKIFYRPAPSPGHLSDRASIMLREVHAHYPVSVFTPSGEYVSGYPDVSRLANASRELGLPVAMVEFSRQVGEPQLNALASPLVMPLHSVTNEEMTARRISRSALRDRLIRAAVERSVRLLLLRTAPPNTSNFTFRDFAQEVKLLGEGLKSHGFNLAWPSPVFANKTLHTNIFAALAMSVMFAFSLYCWLVRMGMNDSMKARAVFGVVALVLCVVMYRVSFVARVVGAFTAPLIATEAALLAMDGNNSRKIIPAFLFAVVGGLALASFFSVADYMLRLRTFSGVKLTLILPPLLVILHDLKKRIHPESVTQFLSRPPLWGELMIILVLLAGVGLIIFRSGNVAFIPGFEARIREVLERVLIARPRTREVFVGYPSILLLSFLVRKKLFAHYREIFRIGVVLGFSSVVNSFCHFHTPITLILLREVNGLWTGLIVGVVLVALVKFVVLPLLRAVRPIIS